MCASTMRNVSFSATIAVVLLGCPLPPAAAAESLLTNGLSQQWTDGAPTGWKIGVGAQTGGDRPESIVRQVKGPALLLQGDAATKLWHSVTQEFPVRPAAYYRIVFEARTKDLKRESNQYDNCCVGLLTYDVAGKRQSMEVRSLFETAWAKGQLVIRAPETAARGEAMIFLSKSGLLGVRNVRLEELRPEDSFDVLVDELDRYYSFFALKAIDWRKLAAGYRPQVGAASGTTEFVTVVKNMLAELKDLHVRIQTPEGRMVPSFSSAYRANFDFQAVAAKLRSRRQIGTLGFVGRTQEGYGVVTVGTMQGEEATLKELETAVEGLFDAAGMIVDLRANGGGSEPWAARLAAMFTDRPRVYARSKIRAGERYDDFHWQPDRTIAPRSGRTYTRPIVCLIGPGCVSSGEALAMMLKALPHATLVGQPTRGASGNPGQVLLPNSATVHYSRWISLLPDETVLEGRGVPPDVPVPHQGPGDPTFDAALKILAERVGAERTDAGQ